MALENLFFFVIHLLFLTLALSAAGRLAGKAGLVAFSSLMAVLANLFVLKQISLGPFVLTPSDPYALFSAFAINLLQRRYGNKIAASTISLNFVLLVIFALAGRLHLLYVPALCDSASIHYQALFSPCPRIIFASLTAFYCCQKIDASLFRFFTRNNQKKRWAFSLWISSAIAQCADTLIFSIMGLYGLVEHLFHIIVVSLLMKCLAAAISSPLVTFLSPSIKESHAQG